MSALTIWAIPGIPEVTAGDDLAALIAEAVGEELRDGDILSVTSKIVSKAEGRQLLAADREQAISDETVRLVASRRHERGLTRIVENRLGLVLAAAGVDASNTPDGVVLLLPEDPDASAQRLRADLFRLLGVRIGIVITDTLGRPWRVGQTDVAIGAAGVRVVDDLRGTSDANGRRLDATIAAVADEIAAATDLVKGKSAATPVAVVRGLAQLVARRGESELPGARSLVRDPAEDMFSLGTAESYAEGFNAGVAATFEHETDRQRAAVKEKL
ncbi:F420-dependent oxidoreductase [Leifsonia sp. Root4]|uniref:coenzyme F420-0:L-glutamate ligase n=1 Tax=Leifsonia sp. Root4 TaxID=1736525 RepID=UPI0006F6C9F2|nr:coenzyme F420-0:L-glutamate ligase [Leifsonia sp. Root4]KQW06268.1 F420-dependent oxidoreductase [Leifsonia sp. Root4]